MVLLGAAFVFSYHGVVDLARQGHIDSRLARFYPVVVDAVLVVALVAAFVLRSSGAVVRSLSWFIVILLLAFAAAGDALHAVRLSLPDKPLTIAMAVAPWVMLAVAFRLWLTMVRHVRGGRATAAPAAAEGGPTPPGAHVPPGGGHIVSVTQLGAEAGDIPVASTRGTAAPPLPRRREAPGHGEQESPDVEDASRSGDEPVEAVEQDEEEVSESERGEPPSGGSDDDEDGGDEDGDEVASTPPSSRVRSSPLPPMDWGPGLGGLTGRRRGGKGSAPPDRGEDTDDD